MKYLPLCIFLLSCTSIIKRFDGSSFKKYQRRTYIYTKYFENHQSSIYIEEDKHFLCSRTRYIKTKNGSDGIEESIGSGEIVIEEGRLIFRNNDCKIEPPFKELRCYITLTSGPGREILINCKSNKGIEYSFWDLEK